MWHYTARTTQIVEKIVDAQGTDHKGRAPKTGESQCKDLLYQYRYTDSCFILEDINVYYKRDVANADREPAAHLDKLVVRAVNLEGQDE